MAKYLEKLKSPKWQKKRLEILQRDNFQCWYCGDNRNTLHVHHEIYLGKDPWDTPNECLTTVCEDCHNFKHIKFNELETFLIDCLHNRDGKKDWNLMKNCIRKLKDII